MQGLQEIIFSHFPPSASSPLPSCLLIFPHKLRRPPTSSWSPNVLVFKFDKVTLWCLSSRRGRPCATKSQTSTAYTQLGPDRCWKFTMCDVSETETWTVFPLKGAGVRRKKVISCYSCSCAHTQEVPGKSDCTEPGSIGAVTTTQLRKKDLFHQVIKFVIKD